METPNGYSAGRSLPHLGANILSAPMNYSVTFIWISMRANVSFDSVSAVKSPLAVYRSIARQNLLNHCILLPVPPPDGWSCYADFEDERSMLVTFYSTMTAVELKIQLQRALVPLFVDRIEVSPSKDQSLTRLSLN
jgi:hypothetical protein